MKSSLATEVNAVREKYMASRCYERLTYSQITGCNDRATVNTVELVLRTSETKMKPLYKTRFMLDELGNLQSEGHGIDGFQTMLSIGCPSPARM